MNYYTTMHQVFISYSNPDKAIADDICCVLEDKGIMCWIAPRNVRPGERYALEIIHGIKNCQIMVLVFTKGASESEHVANEIDRAFNLHKTIIPFPVEDTPMNEEYSYYLSRKHWLVAYPNYKVKLGILAETICGLLGISVETHSIKNNNENVIVEEGVAKGKTHYLKLKSNLDCVLFIDGEKKTEMMANQRLKIPLSNGEYELKFVSLEYPELSKEFYYEMPDKDKLLDVDFQLELMQQEQVESDFDEKKADLLFDSEDSEAALNYVLPFAQSGNALAQAFLGGMYLMGEGVDENYSEAFNWFMRSAEQGHKYGQYGLGVMYDEGIGVEENNEEAVKWYKKAAEQGLADAQYDLGMMYSIGEGVEENQEEAVKWYKKAAEQGLADAQYDLGVMYSLGEGVEENQEEAVKWYKKAAEQGHENAKKKVEELKH